MVRRSDKLFGRTRTGAMPEASALPPPISDPRCNVNYANSAKDIDGVGGSIRSMTLIQASREALIDRP